MCKWFYTGNGPVHVRCIRTINIPLEKPKKKNDPNVDSLYFDTWKMHA